MTLGWCTAADTELTGVEMATGSSALLAGIAVALTCLHLIAAGDAAAAGSYLVDGSALGVALNSVGAQSTAGTARLLYDYPEAQRSEILDLLFKPNYGASFQHLKVESE